MVLVSIKIRPNSSLLSLFHNTYYTFVFTRFNILVTLLIYLNCPIYLYFILHRTHLLHFCFVIIVRIYCVKSKWCKYYETKILYHNLCKINVLRTRIILISLHLRWVFHQPSNIFCIFAILKAQISTIRRKFYNMEKEKKKEKRRGIKWM